MIIVFGGTGFIGRYLTNEMVHQGMDILAVGKSKEGETFCKEYGIPFMRMDITKLEDFSKLPRNNVEAVVNLAAILTELQPTVKSLLMVNTLSVYNILEYCRTNGINKIIHTTTHKSVEDLWELKYLPISPNIRDVFSGPASPYIISKIASEKFVEHYSKDYGIIGIILRLTGVRGYGEILGSLNIDGSYKKSAFELFVERAIKGESIEIWGRHIAQRDHIYVKDVVSCILAGLTSNKANGFYNVASGTGVTLDFEAKAIIKVFSSKDNPSKIIYRPDIIDSTPSWIYDISKTKADFGWSPKYSYEEWLLDFKNEAQQKKFKHYHFVKESDKPIYW